MHGMMMRFAIELYFDRESEARVRQLWAGLAKADIHSKMIDWQARPHISLTVIDKASREKLLAGLAELVKRVPVFEVQLSSVGSFPTDEGVVFLAPVVTVQLLQLHKLLHDWLKREGIHSLAYYLPENWVPHCTVAIDLPEEKVATAVAFCRQQVGVYGRVQIKSVGLVELSPAAQVQEVETFPLLGDS